MRHPSTWQISVDLVQLTLYYRTNNKNRRSATNKIKQQMIQKAAQVARQQAIRLINNSNNAYVKKGSRPKRNKMKAGNKPSYRGKALIQRFDGLRYNLTDVASCFAIALSDPFSAVTNAVSMPIANAGPSYKVKVTKRIVVTTGSTGNAMVTMCPCLANDKKCVVYSSASTFVGPAMTNTSATTGTSIDGFTKLPFNSSHLSDMTNASSVAGRVISFGWKINYIGSETNKGGVYYCLAFSDRSPVNGLAPSDIGDYQQTEVRAIDRTPMEGVVYPVNSHEWSYSNDNQTDSDLVYWPYSNSDSGDATTIPAFIGIAISAVAGTTFELQLVQHVEYIGKGAQPFLTPSESDISGFEHVLSAAGETSLIKNQLPNGYDPVKLMVQALRSRGHDLSPGLASKVRSVAYGGRLGASLVKRTLQGIVSFTDGGPFK